MVSAPEVVITGLGVVSPIGVGRHDFGDALREGRSGVAPLTGFDASELPVRFGAEVRDFDGKQYVKPRKSLKVMCREIQLGYSAAVLAIEDARLDTGSLDPDRFGVVYGSEMFYCDIHLLESVYRKCSRDGQFSMDQWAASAGRDLYPLFMLMHLPNMIACHLGIAYDARGHNNTISIGEASSVLALIEATRVVQRGLTDVMIVGGVGTRLNPTPLLYRGDSNLSHRNADPAAASRPFDADRDGMVNGEGAAALVLERREAAEARGADVLARVVGWGSSCEVEPYGSRYSGDGVRRCLRTTLKHAGLSAAELGHVNAHGASTVEDDATEAQAIRDCLGETPVTAPKSYFGNLGAGGGMVELAASILALVDDRVPVTLNYATPDPACPITVVCGEPLEGAPPRVLKLSRSGTGQTAAVVLERT